MRACTRNHLVATNQKRGGGGGCVVKLEEKEKGKETAGRGRNRKQLHNITYYYSTVVSFYHLMARERAKYASGHASVIHCTSPV